MAEAEEHAFFEVTYDQLIPFLCEHTGLTGHQARQFLEAQRLYWELHPDGLTYALEDDGEDE